MPKEEVISNSDNFSKSFQTANHGDLPKLCGFNILTAIFEIVIDAVAEAIREVRSDEAKQQFLTAIFIVENYQFSQLCELSINRI
ncbi:hypothetical protein MA16_Dca000139 [Dendrobium catenatum]|uniref:Uncharacterized protein n=1 Tax=Dendrobium catenatum TaxID=906689 RepID=A0A2I0WT14_9ASPA|nr:hypothetical protein MA16_Dca000139 [Dendrobium catenatum]